MHAAKIAAHKHPSIAANTQRYTLEVQRLFFEWFFRKDYCFSKGLLSTDPGKCHFYGL